MQNVTKCLNELPSKTTNHRLAIVGEAPGVHEEKTGKPFVGPSGYLLWAACPLDRSQVFVGNVCQVRPPNNDISKFALNGPEIREGLEALKHDLEVFKPNCLLLLGSTALSAVACKSTLEHWRGSVIPTPLGYKAVATYHPAAVLRDYKLLPIFRLDINKAVKQSLFSEIRTTERCLNIDLTPDEIVDRLENIKTPVAIDIEGGVGTIECISIATSKCEAFIVPLYPPIPKVWRALKRFLESDVPKVLQNCLYDAFVLEYSYGIKVNNIADDIMLKHWELFPEFPKSLAFQASIYTDEPYWKDEGKTDNKRQLYLYCCKDAATTYEINEKLPATQHYRFNMQLIRPLLDIQLRGFRFDVTKRDKRVADIKKLIYRLQWALNEIAGYHFEPSVDNVKEYLCFKKQLDIIKTPEDLIKYSKITELHNSTRIAELLKQPQTPAVIGEIEMLINYGINVNSPKQVSEFFGVDSSDILSLLNLFKKTNDILVKLLLLIRSYRTRLETLESKVDKDNRMRCAYNIVGTETGRISCYKSNTGSGFNLQTVTKKDRDLFIADEGYWLFQCDLSGADGWTVAAHCAALGDRTMLEHYLNGIKPAKILAVLYNKGYLPVDVKAACKEIDSDGWLYFACKRIMHGSNYGMGERTISEQILKDSYKLYGEPITVAPATCKHLQELYFKLYPGVRRWHKVVSEQIRKHGYIVAASGHKRTFFGRRDDLATLKEALAFEPQANTTYVTNLALLRLSKRLIILHQVHDAVIGEFDDPTWAVPFIVECFNNPIKVAGIQITIPFEGAYGTSWGNLSTPIH